MNDRMKLLALFLAGTAAASASAFQHQAPQLAAPAQAALSAAPVTAEEARATALSLARMLEEDYVLPDVAMRYGAALRAKAAAGAYDGIASAQDLARALTADLQAVAPDNHLRVTLRGSGGGPQLVRVRAGQGGAARHLRPAMAGGSPIEEARWLAPGIAYIRFTLFSGQPEQVAATEKFMRDHADAKTLIIDVRTHRGGTLGEMDAMFPFLYGKETVLVQMDTRASVEASQGSPIGGESLRKVAAPQGVVRREHFVTPHPTETRLHDAKVYLLTSGFTASAAEHFALSLKRTGRATLIGEETAGAGNYGGTRPVGERFAAFIPVGLTRDPTTGARWEGKGIKPDVAVPAEQALIEALKLSGVPAEEAERLSAEVRPAGSMARRSPLS